MRGSSISTGVGEAKDLVRLGIDSTAAQVAGTLHIWLLHGCTALQIPSVAKLSQATGETSR